MTLVETRTRRDHTSAESLFRSGAHIFLKQNNFVELSANPAFVRSRTAAIQSGMETITSDPKLRELFPFYGHLVDGYGSKYQQETGLKHEQSDGENKFVFQYIDGVDYPTDNHACRAFLRALSEIDAMGREYAIGLAECHDTAFGNAQPYEGTLVDRVRRGTSVTRVLRYLPVEDGASDAYPHIDRGIISIHWKASHEGLYVFLPDGSKTRVRECENDSVCAFFGRKYVAATQQIGNGCPHGVRYDRKPGKDRYSIVTFVHPAAVDSDVAWLLAHDAEIKAYERSITL